MRVSDHRHRDPGRRVRGVAARVRGPECPRASRRAAARSSASLAMCTADVDEREADHEHERLGLALARHEQHRGGHHERGTVGKAPNVVTTFAMSTSMSLRSGRPGRAARCRAESGPGVARARRGRARRRRSRRPRPPARGELEPELAGRDAVPEEAHLRHRHVRRPAAPRGGAAGGRREQRAHQRVALVRDQPVARSRAGAGRRRPRRRSPRPSRRTRRPPGPPMCATLSNERQKM